MFIPITCHERDQWQTDGRYATRLVPVSFLDIILPIIDCLATLSRDLSLVAPTPHNLQALR